MVCFPCSAAGRTIRGKGYGSRAAITRTLDQYSADSIHLLPADAYPNPIRRGPRAFSVQTAAEAEPASPAMMDGLEPLRKQGFIYQKVKNVAFTRIDLSGQESPAFRVERGQDLEWRR